VKSRERGKIDGVTNADVRTKKNDEPVVSIEKLLVGCLADDSFEVKLQIHLGEYSGRGQ
jgi:hypothetical protein